MPSLCLCPILRCRVPLIFYVAIGTPTIHEPAPIHSRLILRIACTPSLAIVIPHSLTPCATCLRNGCSYRVPLHFCCQFCPCAAASLRYPTFSACATPENLTSTAFTTFQEIKTGTWPYIQTPDQPPLAATILLIMIDADCRKLMLIRIGA